jgi:hypothetical protein
VQLNIAKVMSKVKVLRQTDRMMDRMTNRPKTMYTLFLKGGIKKKFSVCILIVYLLYSHRPFHVYKHTQNAYRYNINVNTYNSTVVHYIYILVLFNLFTMDQPDEKNKQQLQTVVL